MLPLRIALRFLRSSVSQTALIVLGISIGVSVQVFIGSLIGGLQASLVDTTIGSASQITVQSEENIPNYDDIYDELILIDGVETVSYALDANGTLIHEDNTNPMLLRGFDLDKAEGIYGLEDKLVQGRMPEGSDEILVGIDVMEDLDLQLFDTVTVSFPLIGEATAEIVGVYDFNVASINRLWIVSTLETAQTFLGTGDVVSRIEMQVEDVFAAETISAQVEGRLASLSTVSDSSLTVSNWIEDNQELLTGLEAQSSSSLMIQVFVTISVVLGITSVLAITVIQKSRQIGILKAMGIKDRTASLIFLSEGFLLGIFGAVFGVLLGLLLTYLFSTFALDPQGNPVVPLLLDPQFILISAIVAVFSASFASILPARRSSRLSVIEVIKNG